MKFSLKIIALFAALVCVFCCLSACNKEESVPFEVSEAETDYVMIDVEKYGKIVVQLAPETAPITVANFKKLVSEHFYDGLIFHRVIEGFMIQGGDPEGTGRGGSDETIVGEFSKNGIPNDIKHTRGVISMARSGAHYNADGTINNGYNTASSQFFICHEDAPHLNGSYAAFGKVVYGMDVVDRIASVKTDSGDKPTTNVVMTTIRFVTPTETEA